jgi:hypothetical protein
MRLGEPDDDDDDGGALLVSETGLLAGASPAAAAAPHVPPAAAAAAAAAAAPRAAAAAPAPGFASPLRSSNPFAAFTYTGGAPGGGAAGRNLLEDTPSPAAGGGGAAGAAAAVVRLPGRPKAVFIDDEEEGAPALPRVPLRPAGAPAEAPLTGGAAVSLAGGALAAGAAAGGAGAGAPGASGRLGLLRPAGGAAGGWSGGGGGATRLVEASAHSFYGAAAAAPAAPSQPAASKVPPQLMALVQQRRDAAAAGAAGGGGALRRERSDASLSAPAAAAARAAPAPARAAPPAKRARVIVLDASDDEAAEEEEDEDEAEDDSGGDAAGGSGSDEDSEDEGYTDTLVECGRIAADLRSALGVAAGGERFCATDASGADAAALRLVSASDVRRACAGGDDAATLAACPELKSYQLVGVNFLLLLHSRDVEGGARKTPSLVCCGARARARHATFLAGSETPCLPPSPPSPPPPHPLSTPCSHPGGRDGPGQDSASHLLPGLRPRAPHRRGAPSAAASCHRARLRPGELGPRAGSVGARAALRDLPRRRPRRAAAGDRRRHERRTVEGRSRRPFRASAAV